MDSEQVLVIPTRILHEAGLFQGLTRDVEGYVPRLLDPRHFRYLPRLQAEDDPSFKQIIPYVVLRHGDQLFHYRRGKKGGEKRLQARRSIGVGGHVNPGDDIPGEHPYQQALRREVAEEVFLDTGYREHCLGLINDDSLPVGQVHLGIVHIFELEAPRVRRREAALDESGFAPLDELLRAKADFETWSQFVLEALA